MADPARWIIMAGLAVVLAVARLDASDQTYKVTGTYETDDQGRVLSQSPFSGRVVLRGDGTYLVELHVKDEGTYRLVKANPQQPTDMIFFESVNNYRFFAYAQPDGLSVWLNKNPRGANVWVRAEPVTEPGTERNPVAADPAPAPQATPGSAPPSGVLPGTRVPPPGLIQKGLFTQTAMYGNTSAPSYYREDRLTGELSADEKGIILRPDGTYFLRAELGSSVMTENGRYSVSGDTIRIVFDDGSSFDMKIIKNGQALHWYSGGMLISEFLFLGTVQKK
jgi:hypothetical protein